MPSSMPASIKGTPVTGEQYAQWVKLKLASAVAFKKFHDARDAYIATHGSSTKHLPNKALPEWTEFAEAQMTYDTYCRLIGIP
jgi:hypothetical protein